jgi:hypothetical protein
MGGESPILLRQFRTRCRFLDPFIDVVVGEMFPGLNDAIRPNRRENIIIGEKRALVNLILEMLPPLQQPMICITGWKIWLRTDFVPTT